MNLPRTIFLVFLLLFFNSQFTYAYTESEIEQLAKENLAQLKKGIIDTRHFVGAPDDLCANPFIAVFGLPLMCNKKVRNFFEDFLHFRDLSGISTASLLLLFDESNISKDGSLTIPNHIQKDLIVYYKENYQDWIFISSTKEDFGVLALYNVMKFIKENDK